MSILVIGDLIEDKYHFVDVRRVSPEAPCLIGLDVSNETKFGGAANVAMNMLKLRSSVALCGACDEAYEHLLQEAGFNGSRLLTGRHSTKHRFVDVKTRMQVFRHDVESLNPGDDVAELELYNNFIKGIEFPQYRVCVVVDYMKGMVKPCPYKPIEESLGVYKIPGCVINIVSTKNRSPQLVLPVQWISKRKKMKSSNILIVNEEEYRSAKEIWGYEYIIRTEGENGITLIKVEEDQGCIDREETEIFHVDGRRVDVFDVTGAGDTVTAVVACLMDKFGYSDETLKRAVEIANYAASVVVTRHGTSVIEFKDIAPKIVESEW